MVKVIALVACRFPVSTFNLMFIPIAIEILQAFFQSVNLQAQADNHKYVSVASKIKVTKFFL